MVCTASAEALPPEEQAAAAQLRALQAGLPRDRWSPWDPLAEASQLADAASALDPVATGALLDWLEDGHQWAKLYASQRAVEGALSSVLQGENPAPLAPLCELYYHELIEIISFDGASDFRSRDQLRLQAARDSEPVCASVSSLDSLIGLVSSRDESGAP